MKLYRFLLAACLVALPTAALSQTCSGEFTAGQVCANSTASTDAPGSTTVTALLDRAICSTNNSALARLSGSWACLASANNAVWVTSAAGVPSLSATLPSGLTIPGYAATASVRTKLTANQTFYYRKDGSDSNTCLTDSAGGACLTVQAAVNKASTYDFNGFSQIVRRGSDAGTQTWTEDISIQNLVGGGSIVLTGNGTATQTIFAGTGASTTTIGASFTGATNVSIYGISITCGATGRGIFAGYQSTITVGVASPTTRFGACGTQMVAHDLQGLIQVLNATIEIYGGGGCHVANGGQFFYEAVTLTLTGTPNFSSGWWCQSAGFAQVSGLTIASGTATGNKYNVSGGITVPISMTPNTAFPGSTLYGPYNGGRLGATVGLTGGGPAVVADLPTCNANWIGAIYSVFQSSVTTWGSVVAGGGASTVLVHCNGGNWTVFAN